MPSKQAQKTTSLDVFNPLEPSVISYGYTSNVQHHKGLTYIIFNFWHSGTLALSPERQSVRMLEIKNGRLGLYGKV